MHSNTINSSGSRNPTLLIVWLITITLAMVSPSLVQGMALQTQKVAIIGGGIAGLSCAQHLSTRTNNGSAHYDVTVFDTGRLRPGGRCSTRQSGDVPKNDENNSGNNHQYPLLSKYRFDHAAQMISINQNDSNNPMLTDFQEQVMKWEKEGIVKKFPQNSVCRITKNGKIQPLSKVSFYHGTNGMGELATSIVSKSQNFKLQQDVWVSPSSGVRYQKNTGKWKLQASGKTLGIFDQLIIAHNGKCADRIMSQTPAKDVHELLRVNFNPTVPAFGGKKMTLNSIYSLTVCLKKNKSDNTSILSKGLPENLISAFCDHPQLRMITCQTRKYPNSDDEHEVWTILSSAQFAKKYKAPQEFLPEETIEEVSALLLKAVEKVVGLRNADDDGDEKPIIQPLEKRLQLWGAAVPLNVWTSESSDGRGFIYDSDNKVGVCGDWLVEPSIAGAWTSGKLLATHMQQKSVEKTGLNGKFERSESASKLGIASLAQ